MNAAPSQPHPLPLRLLPPFQPATTLATTSTTTLATATVTVSWESSAKPVSGERGWVLPGQQAAVWLTELTRWPVPLTELRLYPLPFSLAEGGLVGVFVHAQTPFPADAAVGRCWEYECLGGKLWLPKNATLSPPISAQEVQEQFSGHLFVFHPSSGLIRLEPADGYRVGDLLQLPPYEAVDWNAAQAGNAPVPLLMHVAPTALPPLQEFFKLAQEDIGSRPLQDLPKTGSSWFARLYPKPKNKEAKSDNPKESTESASAFAAPAKSAEPAQNLMQQGWQTVNHWGQYLVDQVSHALTHLVPTNLSIPAVKLPNWLDQLQNWAQQRQLEARRASSREDRQLEELRQLLENDPDRGLQYALPLRFDGPNQADAASGAGTLAWHKVDFDLHRLGRQRLSFGNGKFASPEAFEALRKIYRDLANRELQLNRHRRAAYILAELLGDFESAAAALKAGRFFREAAALFNKHLRQPIEAARCLEQGGLLIEAITLYLQESQYETAGDLWARLGQVEEAEAAYRMAVEVNLQNKNWYAAGVLAEQKLQLVDEALDYYQQGWEKADLFSKQSSSVGPCLEKQIQLLARLQRHDSTQQVLERLAALDTNFAVTQNLVQTLARRTPDYPDPVTRHRMADFTRCWVGQKISRLLPGSAAELLKALPLLAPTDKLLQRDTMRYVELQRELASPSQSLSPSAYSNSQRPKFIATVDLAQMKIEQWLALLVVGKYFYAAGLSQQELVFIQSDWEHQYSLQSLNWPLRKRFLTEKPQLQIRPIDWSTQRLLGLFLQGHPPLKPRFFPTRLHGNASFTPPVKIMTPDFFPDNVLAWDVDDRGMHWLVCRGGTEPMPYLCNFTGEGQLNSTKALQTLGDGRNDCVLLARWEQILIGQGQCLLVLRAGRPVETLMLGGPIRKMVAPVGNNSGPIAILTDAGLALLWPGGPTDSVDRLFASIAVTGTDIVFVHENRLLLLNNDKGRFINLDPNLSNFQLSAPFPLQDEPIVALSQGSGQNTFALLTHSGKFHYYKF